MTPIAPHVTAFFHERLVRQRNASPNTCDSYAYAFQLLLAFAAQRLRTPPSELMLEHVDARLVLDFLDDLELTRKNSARTRNARLAAIKSFARFVQYRVPSAIDQISGLLAIPSKRTRDKLVGYLLRDEAQAILDAPNPRTRTGVRDRAMLHLTIATGLRVSELVGLRIDELVLRPQATIRVRGKGRRERVLPLWKTTARALQAWLAVRGDAACPELFLNARGGPLSRAGFEYVLEKHAAAASVSVPSLATKRISPHALRHTCAMQTLQATHDIRKVALWLGHASIRTTEIYLRSDPTSKLETIEAVLPPALRRGRFRPQDKLIDSLRPSRRDS